MRWTVLSAGLPPPLVQFPVLDDGGVARYWLDTAWPEALVAAEYDGVEPHSGNGAFRRDRRRSNWLLARGWRVLRVTAADLHHPGPMLYELALPLGW